MAQKEKVTQLPYVSIVMPMFNEESFIARCLDSIIANDYPSDRFEVLVVDGMSTDRSREIVKTYSEASPNIKLLDNPKKIRVTANNIGILAAKGEVIISMDAHVLYALDYISSCVDLLQTSGAANVGGVQRAVGYNYVTHVIALATTTPFGIGDAEFRYADREKWVDTVYLGAWYRKMLEKVGLFNEEWRRNGDYELNYRIRKAGGRILLSPRIKCQYFVRGSLRKLMKQYFLYGIWRVKTIVTHPDSVRWRHLLPPLLILWLLLTPLLLILGVSTWWIPVTIYIAYSIATSLGLSIKRGIVYFPLLVPTLWILHLSWGIGFYLGILKFGLPKIRFRIILKDIVGKRTL